MSQKKAGQLVVKGRNVNTPNWRRYIKRLTAREGRRIGNRMFDEAPTRYTYGYAT